MVQIHPGKAECRRVEASVPGHWRKDAGRGMLYVVRRCRSVRNYADVQQASPFDRIWGVGYTAADAEDNKDRWGHNLLGKALMRVRERLQAIDKASEAKKTVDPLEAS